MRLRAKPCGLTASARQGIRVAGCGKKPWDRYGLWWFSTTNMWKIMHKRILKPITFIEKSPFFYSDQGLPVRPPLLTPHWPTPWSSTSWRHGPSQAYSKIPVNWERCLSIPAKSLWSTKYQNYRRCSPHEAISPCLRIFIGDSRVSPMTKK